MADFRRAFIPGGTYFFTLVTANRRPIFADAGARRALGESMRRVRHDQPFVTIALVLLPDHLHAIWRLPEEDADFPMRWCRIKQLTTLRLRSLGIAGRVWQRRYWEHAIRDEADLARHFDYIHYNPVKHGHVETPREWSATTFHRFVRAGVYTPGWAGPSEPADLPE